MDEKTVTGSGDIDLAGDADRDADDTEGHSMLQFELARNVASSRSKEASDWARSQKARHDKDKKAAGKK